MSADHSAHVRHTLIRDFHCTAVEYFLEWVTWREGSVNNSEELFAHVCLYCRVPWWVEPGDPAAARLPLSGGLGLGVLGWSKQQGVVVATLSKGFLVWRGSCLKHFLVSRYPVKSFKGNVVKYFVQMR